MAYKYKHYLNVSQKYARAKKRNPEKMRKTEYKCKGGNSKKWDNSG